MLRTLQYVFIGLMVVGGLILLKNLSEYFGVTGDGPFIHGWVTMATEQDTVGTPYPGSKGDLTMYQGRGHQLIKIEFAEMNLMLQERYLAYIISHVIAWVLGIIVLYQMYRILYNLEHGRVFHETNVRRIRHIALAILCIPILLYMSGWILEGIAYNFHGRQYTTDMPNLHRERVAIGALLALVIFAFGEIFRTGIRLKDDHDLAI